MAKSPRAGGSAKNAKLRFTCLCVLKNFTHANHTDRVAAVKHCKQNKARIVVLWRFLRTLLRFLYTAPCRPLARNICRGVVGSTGRAVRGSQWVKALPPTQHFQEIEAMQLWQSLNIRHSKILWRAKYKVNTEPIIQESSVFPTTVKRDKSTITMQMLACTAQKNRYTFMTICNGHNVNERYTQVVGTNVKAMVIKKWIHLQSKMTRQKLNKIREEFPLPSLFIYSQQEQTHWQAMH